MEALLAQDVGDGMILMYDHHHHRPLVTAPGGVAGDGADERQDAHLELAGQQALVEQALLDPSQVGVRNAEEQHGSGGTIRGEGQALLRIERPEDPSLGMADLELLPGDGGEVAGVGKLARWEIFAVQQSIGSHEAANRRPRRPVLAQLLVEPDPETGVVIRREFHGPINDHGTGVGAPEARDEDLERIELNQQAASVIAAEEEGGRHGGEAGRINPRRGENRWLWSRWRGRPGSWFGD